MADTLVKAGIKGILNYAPCPSGFRATFSSKTGM
jgi:NADH/NAD ratio-sensing transcriptional regulator Rex